MEEVVGAAPTPLAGNGARNERAGKERSGNAKLVP